VQVGAISVADEDERTGTCFEHVGKILAAHDRWCIGLDSFGADDFGGDCRRKRRFMRTTFSRASKRWEGKTRNPKNLVPSSTREMTHLRG